MARTWIRELDEYPIGAKRRKILSMAVLASLICSYEGAIAPTVPLLMADLNIDLVTYGLISAGALLLGALAGLIGGPMSDKYGRVRVLVPLMALTAFLAFSMVFVTDATGLAIVRGVLSFVEGIAVASTAPLVRDFSPRMGRAQAMGFWTWGPVGANFISAAIAAITLPMFNNAWHSQFVIIGVLSLVASVVIALNIADLSPRLRSEILQTERKVLEEMTADEAPAKASTLLKSPTIWAHTIGIGLWLLLYLTITAFGQTMIVQTFDKSAAEASLIMTVFWVVDIGTVILFGRWSDKLQLRRPFTLVFTVLSVLGIVYLASLMGDPTTSTVHLAITGAVIGCVMGGAYSPWMANFSENSEDLDPRLQGTTWGLFNFVVKFVAMLVVIIAPITVEATGSWQVWMVICAVSMGLFILTMPLFKGPWTRPKVTPEEALLGQPAPDGEGLPAAANVETDRPVPSP